MSDKSSFVPPAGPNDNDGDDKVKVKIKVKGTVPVSEVQRLVGRG